MLGRVHSAGASNESATLFGRRGVIAENVAPGTHDLVLEFEEAPSLEVHCRDADGQAIDSIELRVIEFEQADLSVGLPRAAPPVRAECVFVPARAFYLEVQAEGFGRRRLGPFDPNAAPALLEPVLGRDAAPREAR